MAEKKTKIQPVSDADKRDGQPSQEATDIQDITADKFASMNDADKAKYINDAQAFIRTATQKSQEAAEVKRQNEQLRVDSEYWKKQAEETQGHLRKVVEQMTQPQQTTATPSQPPEYDPYNPDKWAREYQAWHENRLKDVSTQNAELKKSFDSLRDEFNVGLRTINVERYLEKAIPKYGKDVDADEIVVWFQMHPEIQASTETINQAITERQAKIDAKAEAKMQELLAQKEADAQKVQDAEGGAPWAGGAPNHEEFVKMTPAQKNEKVAEYMERSLKASGGGG
jgi:hypothetical protein